MAFVHDIDRRRFNARSPPVLHAAARFRPLTTTNGIKITRRPARPLFVSRSTPSDSHTTPHLATSGPILPDLREKPKSRQYPRPALLRADADLARREQCNGVYHAVPYPAGGATGQARNLPLRLTRSTTNTAPSACHRFDPGATAPMIAITATASCQHGVFDECRPSFVLEL